MPGGRAIAHAAGAPVVGTVVDDDGEDPPLYAAGNRRGPRARSGTSGPGSVASSMHPAWWRVSSEGSIVVVIGDLFPRPLCSMNQQLDLAHRRC